MGSHRGALSHLKTGKQGQIQGNVSRRLERNTSRNSYVAEKWLKKSRARDKKRERTKMEIDSNRSPPVIG